MDDSFRIRVLMENQAGACGLRSEHGLSFWIEEAGGASVSLFDTGQSGALIENARLMDLDLQRIQRIALSHGHYDHSGGLAFLGDLAASVPVHAHGLVEQTRYSIRPSTGVRMIGMPQAAVAELGRRQWVKTQVKSRFSEQLWLTGAVPRVHALEDVGGPFFLDADGQVPDLIEDDQALWFISSRGLVVLLGCAHSGLINTVNLCMEQSGIRHLHAIIGGLHLLEASQARLDATYEALLQWKPEVLAPCHCTGSAPMEHLRREFASFRVCEAGSCFEC
jgi:7,8-dihydropterin-6-yl-methyl-4-(beta-D-ribofuranosyl)aminobenzene 5'-phosphate synthase